MAAMGAPGVRCSYCGMSVNSGTDVTEVSHTCSWRMNPIVVAVAETIKPKPERPEIWPPREDWKLKRRQK